MQGPTQYGGYTARWLGGKVAGWVGGWAARAPPPPPKDQNKPCRIISHSLHRQLF